jgi:small subunit ribosomal protein S16
MSVVIRMKRTGRRNRPCYRITVCDSRLPRDGRVLDNLGLYDPISSTEEKQLTLDVERARYWVGKGALPSDTVNSIFKRNGVFEGLPPKAYRKRTGRGPATATRKARLTAKADRITRKGARRVERLSAKKAAAAEAKAAEGSEE